MRIREIEDICMNLKRKEAIGLMNFLIGFFEIKVNGLDFEE